MTELGQMGIYIHWPFCLSKCPYCDFNVHVRSEIDHARWRAAYVRALEHYQSMTRGRIVRSIFFGGGTPSTMQPETVGAIIDAVRKLWPCVNDLEVTLEANPTSVEIDKFRAFREAGVNRVSIGVQSLRDDELKFLGRAHSEGEARKAIAFAQEVFERSSFDLIYARPKQTLDDWRAELSEACEMAAGHLSLYQLTIERNTPFYFEEQQGKFSVPEEGLAADFYDLTQSICAAHNLPAYEVSNHGALGQESEHNLIYWRYGDYIGIGPGAHGRLTLMDGKVAIRDHHAPDVWLARVEEAGSGAHPFEPLLPKDRFTECLMMGLRVCEGLALSRLNDQGAGDWQDMVDIKRYKLLENEGFISCSDDRLILSQSGMLRLNAIVNYLLK
ncbi:MAG: radical SAM family heme chaperone HemW [Micavibrio sp.]|nr:radical SAM family heme chaperone HemW [Micavibrio sp.]